MASTGAVALSWQGALEDAGALARLRHEGAQVSLALDPRALVPDFVLEAQAASLGSPLARPGAPAQEARRDDGPFALAQGFRGFIVAAPDKDLLGRFVDAGTDLAGTRTLAVDGGFFRRRVDVVVGEAQEADGGWWLEVGLKGC
ncbi:MAG TPA: hypothetical protein VM370_03505 [Candidatus Thermoplasmatota archaeon]|nr:hypothetical protein [Candidatus Thermoplasmatota archaeon]